MLPLVRKLPLTLIAAATLFAVATPADAKVVYRWKTDDGVYAFTDDAKRIPEKYRAEAKASPLRTLRGYKNYTPAQHSGTKAHVKEMQQTARDLRKLNARLYGQAPAPTGAESYYGGQPEEAVLRVGSAGQSNVEIQTSALDGDEPIVIEQKRYYVPGLNVTRRDTIVKQGGRILAITKPLANQDDIATIPSEAQLDAEE